MTRRSEERLLPILRERIAALNISGCAVTAHQNFLASPLSKTAADFARAPPDQLGVMRNVLGPPRAAVGGKDPGNKILFFGYPQIDHGLGPEHPWRSSPDILALGRAAGDIGRMLEPPRAGKVIGPVLCAARQLRIPAQWRNPRKYPLAIMARQQTRFEVAEARLSAREQRSCYCQKGDLRTPVDEPRHDEPPS